MKKWLLSLLILIMMGLVVACDNSDAGQQETEGNDEQTFTIGASQIVEHPSLDQAFNGFKQALEDGGLNVTYDFQSAQGEQTNALTIAQSFVADGVDLIFANSTPSALTALQASEDTPIVFTSVTDAVSAGLVEAMDQPGEYITGVTDMHPDSIIQTVQFIETYYPDSTIGVIYNSGEQNSVVQIDAINDAVEGTSLSVVDRTVQTSAEVQQAASSLVGDADIIFIVTDNTVVSALESVVSVANDQNIPLIVGEPDSLERGGFATYGIDYFTIGYRAGEMAYQILTGEKSPNEIDVEYPPEMQLYINKEAAELQGVTWHSDWDDLAQFK